MSPWLDIACMNNHSCSMDEKEKNDQQTLNTAKGVFLGLLLFAAIALIFWGAFELFGLI